MTTKHFVNLSGVYLGGYGDGAMPPNGAIEVYAEPPHGSCVWSGSEWSLPVISKEQQEAARQVAYTAEADPLFFKWQAGEGTEEEWLAKRQEIRERYPY